MGVGNHRILFIVPYYGEFPPYFDMWLLSVSHNPSVDFLLVTDIEYDKPYPPNVKVLRLSFDKLKAKIQSKFDFKISLKTPYKLCDFRPSFGLVFEEELSEYSFWGNCDIDQIFGDIRGFIKDEILDTYEAFEYLGHFMLYKNCDRINSMFMSDGSLFDYKAVYSSDNNCGFDEVTGILQIVQKNDIKQYLNPCYADIMIAHRRFRLRKPWHDYKNQVFYWENGQVYRAYLDGDNSVKTDKFMYLHFSKKTPVISIRDLHEIKAFYCFSDRFIEKTPGVPPAQEIMKYSEYRGAMYERAERALYFIRKIIKYLQISGDMKAIWRAQRIMRLKMLLPEITEKE